MKNLTIFGNVYEFINISEYGVLISVEDNADFVNLAEPFKLELNLTQDKYYEEFGTIKRIADKSVAIAFSESIPITLISDRSSFRLKYLNFYSESPCEFTYQNQVYKILEISHSNIIVVEKFGDYTKGNCFFGKVELLYDVKFECFATIVKVYENRLVLTLTDDISEIIHQQEIGINRNFPEKVRFYNQKTIESYSKVKRREDVIPKKKGFSFFKRK